MSFYRGVEIRCLTFSECILTSWTRVSLNLNHECRSKKGVKTIVVFRNHFAIVLFLFLVYFPHIGHCEKPSIRDLPIFYPKIEKEEIDRFVSKGLSYAESLYGKPAVQPKKIQLRLTIPIESDVNLPKHFQRCDLTDSKNGLFTIYLSRKPSEYAFYGQLAHEIAHILNAQLFDSYIEGLNMVFAEKLLKKEGKDWSGWLKHLQNGKDPIYGSTYFMMKDVYKVAGDRNMGTFLQHTAYTDKTEKRMHINIDAWINSLPFSKREDIKRIIRKYAPEVNKAMINDPYNLTFKLPKQ